MINVDLPELVLCCRSPGVPPSRPHRNLKHFFENLNPPRSRSILNKKNRQASINDHLRKTATCQQRRARIPNRAKTTTILRAYPWTPSDWGSQARDGRCTKVCLFDTIIIHKPAQKPGGGLIFFESNSTDHERSQKCSSKNRKKNIFKRTRIGCFISGTKEIQLKKFRQKFPHQRFDASTRLFVSFIAMTKQKK